MTQCPRHLPSGRSVTQPHPGASQMMSRPEDRRDSRPAQGVSVWGLWTKPKPGGALDSDAQLHVPGVTLASRAFIESPKDPCPYM